jgi:DNA-binding PadR family transcriptional regulator
MTLGRYDSPMRRTPTSLAVAVELLNEPDRDRWSYEIADKLNVDRTSVIRIFRRMVDAGWLDQSWETEEVVGRPGRHYYWVTETGKTELREFITRNPGTEMFGAICSKIAVG